MTSIFRTFFIAVALVTTCLAQTCPGPVHFGSIATTMAYNTEVVAVGDLNGDGIADTVVSDEVSVEHRFTVLLGLGDGRFEPATSAVAVGARVMDIAIGDLDDDGDRDVAVVFAQTLAIYLNDGSGALTQFAAHGAAAGADRLALGDLDVDGDLDIVVSCDSSLLCFANDGGGGMTLATTISRAGYSPHDVEVGDGDGDGFLDLFTAAHNDGVRIRYGSGTMVGFSAPDVVSNSNFQDIELADLDGNGCTDVLCGGGWVSCYLRTGRNPLTSYNAFTSTGYVYIAGIACGDIDGDGDIDAVAVGGWSSEARIAILENQGGGGFLCSTACSWFDTPGAPFDVAVADVEGDGKQDVLVTCSGAKILNVFTNPSGAGLAVPRRVTPPNTTENVAIADLDLDGHEDLIMPANGLLMTQRNLGNGTFAVAQTYATLGSGTHSCAVGDLNGDGLPDVIATNQNSASVSVFLGMGPPNAGSLLPATIYSCPSSPKEIRLADFDQDGDLDAAVVHAGGACSILLNQGVHTASFSTHAVTTAINLACSCTNVSIDVLDANADLYPDVALSGGASGVEVLLNDGTGAIVRPLLPQLQIGSAEGIVAGDLNGDGCEDLVFYSKGGTGGVYVSLQGCPSGSVAAFGGPAFYPLHQKSGISDVEVADVNGDGHLDLVIPNTASDTVAVLMNDGGGMFGAPLHYGTAVDPRDVAVGDLDGDGHPELVTTSRNRIHILDGCPRTPLQWPGTGEDLDLMTGSGNALTGGPGFDRKHLSVAGNLGIRVYSRNGHYANDPLLVGLQFHGTPTPMPASPFPGLWLDVTSPNFVVLVNGLSTYLPLTPGATGLTFAATLGPSLVGNSIVLQATTISPAPTSLYGFALSPAHVITFTP